MNTQQTPRGRNQDYNSNIEISSPFTDSSFAGGIHGDHFTGYVGNGDDAVSTLMQLSANQIVQDSQRNVIQQTSLIQSCILEMVGTAMFVYISLAGVHQTVLSALTSGTNVDQLNIAICFTFGLTSGIVIALKSGAHLNSSVSFTFWLANIINTQKMILYIISQFIGGLVGALFVLAVYYSKISKFVESESLIGSFGTLKDPNNSLVSSFLDQFIGSALLMFGIMKSPDGQFKPLVIGLVLGGLGLFQGTNGFAFNMARDLPPRIISTIIYGADPFISQDYWFWVPIIAPFVGMPVGYVMSQYV